MTTHVDFASDLSSPRKISPPRPPSGMARNLPLVSEIACLLTGGPIVAYLADGQGRVGLAEPLETPGAGHCARPPILLLNDGG